MIKTDYSILYLLIIIPAAVLIAYLLYRRADIPKGRKKLLITLRSISVFLILFLLLFPVFSFLSEQKSAPVNIFLIDNSKSLTLDGRDSILNEIADKLYSRTGNGIEFRYYLFSNGLIKVHNAGEQIEFTETDNNYTDFSRTLSELRDRTVKENISGITFISDGIANKGNDISLNPKAFGYYFNYIRTGDTTQKKDIAIADVLYNKNSYIESKTPVIVRIKSYGITKKVKLNLSEDGIAKDNAEIELNSNSIDYEIKFEITSFTEGIKKYQLEVQTEAGEITDINNHRIFYIRYIPNSFNIAVISAGPSSDYAFLKHQIKKISNFKPQFFTQKTGSEFYEGGKPDLKEISCVIISGYPTEHSNPEIVYTIKEEIERYRLPVFFFAGANTDYAKLKQLENSLPFTIENTTPLETETPLKSILLNEETGKKFSGIKNIDDFPAVFYPRGVFAMKPQSNIYLVNINSDPVFYIMSTGTQTSAAFCAYGIYRWRLNPGDYDYDNALKDILTGTVTTISDYEKNKKISIELSQNEFSPYEKINITVRLNPSYTGGEDSLNLRIYNDKFDRTLKTGKTGEREYSASEVLTEKGDYYIDAYLYNSPFISAQERFTVDINRSEFLTTKPDENFLKRLAENTDGQDFTDAGISDIITELEHQAETRISETQSFKNIYLNYSWLYLISIVFLLALEWFIRKRSFLP
ncbi:MAG: hypothetical protein JW917_02250 [Ignavibacteria bacterium]|nr:hypothetical protein [Ignavibacteria bacterium]